MSARPFESPPPYRPDEFKPSHYAPSSNTYGGEFHSQPMFSQPAYSYYPEDEVQHFYRWTSPPGIIKIMSILIIVMCIGVFACVASTLAWDLYGGSLGTGYLGGYGGYGGYGGAGIGSNYGGFSGGSGLGGYGGYNGAYNFGGSYIDQQSGKGFILAMAAFCFIAGLVIFVIGVTRTSMARTRKYYLLVIIGSAILLFLTFIATIVYILAVNPTAQASGSMFYNQIYMICNQFYGAAGSTFVGNQYLYHYCVVDPQEAIAIVLGFLIVAAFAIIIFFAVKTRSKINYYGKPNILWEKIKSYDDAPNVEEWVKNVEPAAPTPVADYPDRVASSAGYSVSDAPGRQIYNDNSYRATPIPEAAVPLTKDLKQSQYANTSSYNGSTKEPAQKRRAGRPKRTNKDNYDGDYTTGGESCDELEEDWDREYPAVTSDQQRQTYKRGFDAGLQEYKRLQAELDEISKELSRLDKDLDDYIEDSEEYKAAADEYNRLKEIKSSADYKTRKAHCKILKSKLSHIKRMVSDYDSRKS